MLPTTWDVFNLTDQEEAREGDINHVCIHDGQEGHINQYGDDMWLVVSTALSRLLAVGLARGRPGSEVCSWVFIALIRAKSTCLVHYTD